MNFFRLVGSLVDLNHPDHYFHWSFLSISLANLIIIALMVVIFGLAIILPFPKPKLSVKQSKAPSKEPSDDEPEDPNKTMLTYKLRHFLIKTIPIKNLIPDEQPLYVASWIYVFGVATLAALFIVIVSGMLLAIGGVQWWQESTVGHFVNSLHLWGVELFMAFMVIHLWGKFWMSAWRGKRALTWMTGVAAFAVSILEAFTGYLSQQNFDSQWIATNGKDAINAIGLGSFLNLMNFGQIIMWHILLIPLALVFIIGLHILLVRIRGVTHPVIKTKRNKESRIYLKKLESSKWRGPTRQYDIIKEGFIATAIVTLLIFGLAWMLSSPNDPAVTVQSWSTVAPSDFLGTTVSELDGTSETANYGPPYNNGTHNVQKLGVSWQLLTGVRQKIDPAQTFVLGPLSKLDQNNPSLQKALLQYKDASTKQQLAWDRVYMNVIRKVKYRHNIPILPKAPDGPVPIIAKNELSYAQSGAIDSALLAEQPFYGTNYTKPLLFIEDGNYFSSLAKAQHLGSNQWGVMDETGSFPGQPWLWLYALWYQIPGFSTSPNVDLIAIYLTGLATTLLLLVPFIPGLRSIPKAIPVYKLIWRQWYRKNKP